MFTTASIISMSPGSPETIRRARTALATGGRPCVRRQPRTRQRLVKPSSSGHPHRAMSFLVFLGVQNMRVPGRPCRTSRARLEFPPGLIRRGGQAMRDNGQPDSPGENRLSTTAWRDIHNVHLACRHSNARSGGKWSLVDICRAAIRFNDAALVGDDRPPAATSPPRSASRG